LQRRNTPQNCLAIPHVVDARVGVPGQPPVPPVMDRDAPSPIGDASRRWCRRASVERMIMRPDAADRGLETKVSGRDQNRDCRERQQNQDLRPASGSHVHRLYARPSSSRGRCPLVTFPHTGPDETAVAWTARLCFVNEARLEDAGSGLAPVTEGWCLVNVRDAEWLPSETTGAACW